MDGAGGSPKDINEGMLRDVEGIAVECLLFEEEGRCGTCKKFHSFILKKNSHRQTHPINVEWRPNHFLRPPFRRYANSLQFPQRVSCFGRKHPQCMSDCLLDQTGRAF